MRIWKSGKNPHSKYRVIFYSVTTETGVSTKCADADDHIAQLSTMREMQKFEKAIHGCVLPASIAKETFND